MVDALATEVKVKNLARPLHPDKLPNTKINGFMAVHKASGGRRQAGNLSSLGRKSFIDGIPLEVHQAGPVKQMTANLESTLPFNPDWAPSSARRK